jgi:hypothetical protein
VRSIKWETTVHLARDIASSQLLRAQDLRFSFTLNTLCAASEPFILR